MMDLAFVVLTVVFFAGSWWFVRACASLEPKEEKK